MLPYNEKAKCCGCETCVNICPTQALSMMADEEGFRYPEANPHLCIECGACRSVCCYHENYLADMKLPTPLVYAAKHKDHAVKMASTSGGAFTAFSDIVLQQDGIVYGAALDEECHVVHIRTKTSEERDLLRGSKYVQSRMGQVVEQVAEDLRQNKQVLFSGTPCQVAGLYAYLLQKRVCCETLFTCDIFCYGTPSPGVFNSYLVDCKRKYRATVESISFRVKKSFKWSNGGICLGLTKNVKTLRSDECSWMGLFFSHLMLRPACYNCVFRANHVSDVTLFDYWGIDKVMPDFFDEEGVSGIWLNTEKGVEFFKQAAAFLESRQSCVADSQRYNIHTPTPCPPTREQFWQDYHTHGYKYVAKRYGGQSAMAKCRRHVKKILLACNLHGAVQWVQEIRGRIRR